MLGHLAQLSLGLVALVWGGQRVVEHASAFADRWEMSTLFIGVVFVAIGSSIPEIATAIYGGIYETPDFVVGHIVGSATSQITVGIGVVALLAPLSLERAKVRLYGGGMLVAMGLMTAVVWSGRVSRLEGALLAVVYLLFIALSYEEMSLHDEIEHRTADVSGPRAVAGLVAGLVFVVVGGHLLVVGSRQVALAAHVPQLVIGLITGLGTTAPEVAIAAVAVIDGEASIAIGTLFGSNITDPLFSFGVGAVVSGFTFTDVGVLLGPLVYMMLASALVVGLFSVRKRVHRRGALGCLLLYVPTFLV